MHASEEKAKFLEVQRLIIDENSRLRDLVMHIVAAPVQDKTKPTIGSAGTAAATPKADRVPMTAEATLSVLAPASGTAAMTTFSMKKPGVNGKKRSRTDLQITDEASELLKKGNEFLLLNEENVKPLFSMDGLADAWWLDSGASNHMTGSRCKFKEMDESIRGHVKLGDGSTALIKGKGSVIVECKSGEQLHLTEVYFVPSLPSNIISLGKLSEDGNRVVLDGTFLWVRGRSGKVQMKVKRSPNRLYKVLLKTIVRASHVSARKRSEEGLQQQHLDVEVPSGRGHIDPGLSSPAPSADADSRSRDEAGC